MPIKNAIWTVEDHPVELRSARLPTEAVLEQMIVAAPGIISDDWMLIGQQERTGLGGVIDVLAIAPDASLILIELKRERTPREVVAQALDYACWVEGLEATDIAAIYARFAPGRDLARDFEARFGQPLDEEALNASHQIVIVATDLDASSERIVDYLNQRDVAINVLTFQAFEHGGQLLLSRAWLLDPAQTQVSATSRSNRSPREREPWNGEFYASFGQSPTRSWDEARQYSFICAGGGNWYSNTLDLVDSGDRLWVKAPGFGFVGVAEVVGPKEPITEFEVQTNKGPRPALEVLTGGTYHREFLGDPERMEYFLPVRWIHTVPLNEAVNEIGLFGNQNTVCRPTTPAWRTTVERLKARWGIEPDE